MTTLSVVVPWCDRPELVQTLSHNAASFAAVGAEVIIANCGGLVGTLSTDVAAIKGFPLRWVDIRASEFNKGLALNLGASLSQRDALFFLDTDILVESSSMLNLVGALEKGFFVTVASVVETRALGKVRSPSSQIEAVAHTVEFTTASGEVHRIVTNRLDLGCGARAGPGLTLVWRKDFLAIGGMNGLLTGWGWDDLDLIARLQIALGRQRRETGQVMHLSHDDGTRTLSGHSRGESEGRNFMACLAAYSVGDLQGTYEADLAREGSSLHAIRL